MWDRTSSATSTIFNNHKYVFNFKYDVVISSRFDLEILEPLSFELKGSELLIPIGFDWCQGISDLFAVGNSDTMNEYFDYRWDGIYR